MNQLSIIVILNSVYGDLKDPRWREAMNKKMKSLQNNSTWQVTDLPEWKIPVGYR